MMLSGKAAEAAVKVITSEHTSPMWMNVIAICGMLVTIAVAYFKIAPAMRKIYSEMRRDEMISMGERIRTLETKLEEQSAAIRAADDRAHKSEMKATTLAAAVELLLSEIRRLDPESPVIDQAQKLVTVAIQPDFQDVLTKLSTLPATRGDANA